MTQVSPILAQADRLLFQTLIFERLGLEPNALTVAIYSVTICAAVFLPVVGLVAMLFIWWERKVAGHIQSRFGPNRVGPIGLLQSLADGVKLLTKEDLIPGEGDQILYRLAPYIAFAPVFAAYLAIPFGPDLTFEPRLSVGVFWILAILSVEVMGVILAGWASNNKWSVYGAMREACQMVSYEIPLGLSIIVGVMAAGTLNLVDLSHLQNGGLHTWLVFRNPFVLAAFLLYFVASLASNKRAPFDLPESESELVAGFHTEYSGLRWSFFFFAEYGAMFVVAGIQTALFLGGWNDPFGLIGYYYERYRAADNTGGLVALNLLAVAIFSSKVLVLVFVQMWVRWTFPRPRIDQVLHACVKVLLPMACVLLLGSAIWQWLIVERPGVPWRTYRPWDVGGWIDAGYGPALLVQSILGLLAVAVFSAIVLWIIYAFVSGRNLKQRLTPPEPIGEPGTDLATSG